MKNTVCYSILLLSLFNLKPIKCEVNETIPEYAHAKWIIDNLPLFENNSKIKINCINLAISFLQNETLHAQEEQYANDFMRQVFESQAATKIHYRNVLTRQYEMWSCDVLVFISLGTNYCGELKNLSLALRAQYILAILPTDVNTFNSSAELRRSAFWTECTALLHPEVVFIVNRTILKLTSPYQKNNRELKEITWEELHSWVVRRPEQMNNFHRLSVRVSSTNCIPYHYWEYPDLPNYPNEKRNPQLGDSEVMCEYDEKEHQGCAKPSGVTATFMSIISKELNFTWIVNYPPTGEYGIQQPDGSEDGIVGDLMFGRADVTICDLWVQYPRNSRVDFSYPLLQTCATYLVPRPKRLPKNWFSIFNEFSLEIWLRLLYCFVIMWILLWIVGKLPFNTKKPPKSIGTVFFEVLQILTTSDSLQRSTILGQAFLRAIWSYFSTFMILFYSCDVITSLTLPQYEKRIETVTDCLAANLSWGIEATLDFDIFLDMSQLTQRQFSEKFLLIENRNDWRYVNRLVQMNKFAVLANAYFDGTASLDPAIIRGLEFSPPNFRLLHSCVYQPYVAFYFPFNSPLKKAVDRLLFLMFEAGIFSYIKRHEIKKAHPIDWEAIFVDTDNTKDNAPQVLTVKHITGTFVILGFGLGFAAVVFLLEVGYTRWLEKSNSTPRLYFKASPK